MPLSRTVKLFLLGALSLSCGVFIGVKLDKSHKGFSVAEICVPEDGVQGVDKYIRKMSGDTKRYSDDVYGLTDFIEPVSIFEFSNSVEQLGYVFDKQAWDKFNVAEFHKTLKFGEICQTYTLKVTTEKGKESLESGVWRQYDESEKIHELVGRVSRLGCHNDKT